MVTVKANVDIIQMLTLPVTYEIYLCIIIPTKYQVKNKYRLKKIAVNFLCAPP